MRQPLALFISSTILNNAANLVTPPTTINIRSFNEKVSIKNR
uniref:Uncharacterized protein n=1 Tax=Yersinia ruckeri TaxID=29486 RepID=A0A0A8VDE0_YERRU|nr:hypothetical protein CSF007_9985 [Yersinia ruckeri]